MVAVWAVAERLHNRPTSTHRGRSLFVRRRFLMCKVGLYALIDSFPGGKRVGRWGLRAVQVSGLLQRRRSLRVGLLPVPQLAKLLGREPFARHEGSNQVPGCWVRYVHRRIYGKVSVPMTTCPIGYPERCCDFFRIIEILKAQGVQGSRFRYVVARSPCALPPEP
jgi:hypothetical protein